MRRPGLWLTVGALTAGVVLLGAAGCGNSSSSSSSGNSSTPGGQGVVPHVNGGTLKAAHARRHRLHRSRAGLLPDVVADRVRDLRQAARTTPTSRVTRARCSTPEAASALPTVSARRQDLHVHRPARQVQVQHRRAGDRGDVPACDRARPQPEAGVVLRRDVPDRRRQGASGYKGLPAHVSGIKVTGDKLAITLTAEGRRLPVQGWRRRSPARSPRTRPSTPRAFSRSPAPARTTSPAGRSTARSC